MKSAKITLFIYALIIGLTIIFAGGCSSTRYYPEFGESMTRKEARERYKAFNESQEDDNGDAEEKAVEAMEQIRLERDSLMLNRSEFQFVSTALETTEWENVVFQDGTYFDGNGNPFSGKLLSLYPNGSPQLQATVTDGKLQGEAKEYYPGGSTKIIKNYHRGFLVDSLVEYFPNGYEKLRARIVNQSVRGGDEVRDVTVGYFEEGVYKTKSFEKGRIQLINERQRTGRTNLTMPLEDQRGYMLFERGTFGEKGYTTDSRTITAPVSAGQNYENSVVKGEILSSVHLQEDALLLKKVMLDVHPGIYRYNTEDEFEAHFQSFYQKLNRDMSEAEFMKHLAQFTEKIRCGHTYVNPWNMRAEIRERLFGGNIYFPFGFEIHHGKLYVTRNASNNFDIKPGAEILSINGTASSAILDSLYTVAKIDGNNFQAKDKVLELTSFGERDHNFFDFYFPLFFPMQAEVFTVEVRNYGSGQVIAHTQPALSRSERLEIMTSRYGVQLKGKETWSLEIQEDIAILKLGTFATWNFRGFDTAQFFDSTFTIINQSGVENLVIDIRGNRGGLSEPRDLLLSYLTSKEIPCTQVAKQLIVTTRADSSYREYVDTWEEIMFAGIPEGYYQPYDDRYVELLEGGCTPIQPHPNAFKGAIFALGNQSNVSATFTLLNVLQRENLGTYVGLPSGGNSQGINGGSYFFLYMPNSQFEVDIPLKFSSYGKDVADGALMPDELISISQQDVAAGNDAYLQKINELTRQ